MVGTRPRTQMLSFTAMGMPARGGSSSPRTRASIDSLRLRQGVGRGSGCIKAPHVPFASLPWHRSHAWVDLPGGLTAPADAGLRHGLWVRVQFCQLCHGASPPYSNVLGHGHAFPGAGGMRSGQQRFPVHGRRAGRPARNTFSMGITWAVMGTSCGVQAGRARLGEVQHRLQLPAHALLFARARGRAWPAPPPGARPCRGAAACSRFFSSVPAATPSLSASSCGGVHKVRRAGHAGRSASLILGKAMTSRSGVRAQQQHAPAGPAPKAKPRVGRRAIAEGVHAGSRSARALPPLSEAQGA